MRHSYFLLVVASCGFETPGRGPGDDAPPGEGITAAWKLDVAANFAGAGHTLKDMTIDPRGSLTPNAYTYGGLVARGVQGMQLWNAADTDWSNVESIAAAGAGLWRGESLTGASVLQHLGITNAAVVTIWLEGEVWLEQTATESFLVRGDDVAFVELALPGTARYARVPPSDVAVPVETPETGWYPIRIGFADGSGDRTFEFLHATGCARGPAS
jgi:hypothetical protein